MAIQTDLFAYNEEIIENKKTSERGRNENAIQRRQVDTHNGVALERALPKDVDSIDVRRNSAERGEDRGERYVGGDGATDDGGIHRRSSVGDDERRLDSVERGGDGERGGNRISALRRDGGNATDQREIDSRRGGARLEHIVLGGGGKKEKFRANLNAIHALRDIEARDEDAAWSQKKKLTQYVGWGGLPEAFRRQDESIAQSWDREVYELEVTLTDKEYNAAKLSTTDAHYTSKEVVSAMWRCVTRMGFTGGKVLEPACGIGNFIGLMPEPATHNSVIHAVELDNLTARMAEKLYPHVYVHNQGFENSQLFDPQPNSYDLIITNPPFGNQRVHDEHHKKDSQYSIHNYFVLKSLTAIRSNGVVAMVISRYFLDAKNRVAREAVADRAELLGAVRLPNTAFAQNAGTQVTSDIVFFRKYAREEGEEIRQSPVARRWLDIVNVEDANPDSNEPIAVNAYYADNPEKMLGKWGSFGSTIHGTQGALIPHEGKNTAELLNAALANLPTGFMPAPEKVVLSEKEIEGITVAEISAMFVFEGRIYVREADIDGKAQASPITLKPRDFERVLAYIALRDALSKLIKSELGFPLAAADPESVRPLVNSKYDQFVIRFGYLQNRANKSMFRTDPSWSKVAALETHTSSKGAGQPPTVTKAAILNKRTLFPNRPPPRVDTANDALTASLATQGFVDVAYMSSIYDKSQDQIIAELGDRVYEVEVGKHETAESFLSGDVKEKLARMRESALDDSRFGRNVAALEKVIPVDIPTSKIRVKIGAHWLPEEVMSEFVQGVFDNSDVSVEYNACLGKWAIRGMATYERNIQWGTPRRKAKDIVICAIEQRSASVYDRDEDDRSILNVAATAAANAKVDKIKEEFAVWIFRDPVRRDRLGQIYNAKFNTHVDRDFDGRHLTFPGKVDDSVVKLQEHQVNAVWRIISSGKPTLLHHVVGAGKTYTMITAAMEMRRLGTASKPMFVVPNHLIGQWASEFNKLYPSAQILVPEKRDFIKENRELLFARIAQGNWDAVIVAHSSFDRIRTAPETEIDFAEQQITELMTSKIALDEADKRSPTVKEIARKIKALEAQIQKLMHLPRDDGYNFEELGVDALFVDESQEYKNLLYTTSINKVAGIGNANGSKKALQLFTKSRELLKASGGKNLVFASGTPISNSIPEMFTLQRYLDYDRVKELGLAHFDAWARMFGEITFEYELTATQTYRQVSRFSKFGNLPELISGYKTFADVVSREEIEKNRTQLGLRPQIPPLVGNQPTAVIANRSEDQAVAIENLVFRADTLRLPDNMLAVMTDARKIALDMRIQDQRFEDFAGSKINLAASNIAQIYNKTAGNKGVQLVFLDLSTPKGKGSAAESIKRLYEAAEEGDSTAQLSLDKYTKDEIGAALDNSLFSVYDDLKTKLLGTGISEQEIAFIHSANTDEQKKQLFGRVNAGDVRVLLGSTSRLGAGTNVQKRLVALHHLDCPWRPSDVEQREGRMLRPGNALFAADPENFKVQIFRYATKQTLDSRMWQTIECKATFIQQILDLVKEGGREIENGTDEAQLAAIMKAESSGDPRLLEDIALSSAIKKLQLEERAFNEERLEIDYQITRTQKIITTEPKIISEMLKDLHAGEKAPVGDDFNIVVGDRSIVDRVEAGTALIAIHRHRLAAYATDRSRYKREENESKMIGKYADFPLFMALTNVFTDTESHKIVVHGKTNRYPVVSAVTDEASPQGIISSIHSAITKSLKVRIDAKQKELDGALLANKNLLVQKESLGTKWGGAVELVLLEEKPMKLKKAMARDAEQAKKALHQKKNDEAAKNAIEMVD